MSEKQRVDQLLDELTARANPSDLDALDRRFSDKLDGLAESNKLGDETVSRLRTMWALLKAPDDEVPWSKKAVIMAAIGYFVSPLDVIPDVLGKRGYADDELVVRLAYERLGEMVEPEGAGS